MIKGKVTGQVLTIEQPVIAANSIKYLTAQFDMPEEWHGAAAWATFKLRDKEYIIMLDNGAITEDKGLNLERGLWQVALFCDKTNGTRITTTVCALSVDYSGIQDGSPLPEISPTVAEQIASVAAAAKATDLMTDYINLGKVVQ